MTAVERTDPTSAGPSPTAEAFVAELRRHASPDQLPAIERRLVPGDEAFGIRMRDLFAVAKASAAMPLDEVERLLDEDLFEARLGAVCILDVRARARRCTPGERKGLFALYLRRHDRITSWDMVDRAAPSVVGGHLLGRSCARLHELARSADPIRRRTAITAPLWFVKYGSEADRAEVLPLAAALATDPEPVVHLAVGIALKHLGGRDPRAVRAFLEEHGAGMPRAAVRAAQAKLPAGGA
jgi:3-methyladenine DNA glycosylase AlkD